MKRPNEVWWICPQLRGCGVPAAPEPALALPCPDRLLLLDPDFPLVPPVYLKLLFFQGRSSFAPLAVNQAEEEPAVGRWPHGRAVVRHRAREAQPELCSAGLGASIAFSAAVGN